MERPNKSILVFRLTKPPRDPVTPAHMSEDGAAYLDYLLELADRLLNGQPEEREEEPEAA